MAQRISIGTKANPLYDIVIENSFEKLEKLSSENYLSISYFLNRTIMEY